MALSTTPNPATAFAATSQPPITWCLPAESAYAADAITQVLGDPSGWAQAGITFAQVDCDQAGVVVEVLPKAAMPVAGADGWWAPGKISLAEEYLGRLYRLNWRNVVEHEFGHHLCLGHEGSGIMQPGRILARPAAFEIGLVQARVTVTPRGEVRCPHIPGIR